jgi:hypothetical protein
MSCSIVLQNSLTFYQFHKYLSGFQNTKFKFVTCRQNQHVEAFRQDSSSVISLCQLELVYNLYMYYLLLAFKAVENDENLVVGLLTYDS